MDVVPRQPLALRRIQGRNSVREGHAERRDETASLRLRRIGRGAGIERPVVGRRLVKRIQPPGRPDAVDVTLREHGPRPGGKPAPSVEVAEERLAFRLPLVEAVEFGEDAVGDLRACFARDGPRGLPQIGPVDAHEVFPRGVASVEARRGQRQVLQVQRVQIGGRCRHGIAAVSEPMPRASYERLRESGFAHAPGGSAAPPVRTRHRHGVPGSEGGSLGRRHGAEVSVENTPSIVGNGERGTSVTTQAGGPPRGETGSGACAVRQERGLGGASHIPYPRGLSLGSDPGSGRHGGEPAFGRAGPAATVSDACDAGYAAGASSLAARALGKAIGL